jgi:hypothetical protein
MASPDTIVPDPANPQSFNRYTYTLNNPLRYTDPSGHSCVDALEGYPAEEYDCVAEGVPPLVFYLNGLGGAEDYPRTDDTDNEYNFLLFVLSMMAGEENVVHIPLFTEPYRRGLSHLDMIGESLGIGANQTQFAVEQIEQYLTEHPLEPGQQLVMVGSSAGGTIAIEALDLLKERGIYVDQVILRGSFVQEFSLDNVGQVDYIAADPPLSDWRNYSFDINPFDNVSVNEHQVPGFSEHTPQTPRQQRQIAGMVVDLIIDAAIAR